MNTLTTFAAKKLIVTAQDNGNTYQFPVWEFENGAVLVPSSTTNDWFFNAREDIEPNGTAVVIATFDTEETQEFTKAELKESIEGSEREFGFGYDAGKIKELL